MIIRRDNYYFEVVEYTEDLGKITASEEFLNSLKGKTLLEQTDEYFVEEMTDMDYCSYGSSDKTTANQRKTSIWDSSDVVGVIVKDGIIVGLMVKCFSNEVPLFHGKTIQTYFACDEDGTGSTCREDYIRIV